jgi:hypothetical protein
VKQFDNMSVRELCADWIECKATEKAATDHRRDIEDELTRRLEIAETLDGTTRPEVEGYAVKVTGRIDRKVDAEKVQELAAEHDLTDELSRLFRWKPEINMATWKSYPETITKILSPAITAKPGRPSYTIESKEQ